MVIKVKELIDDVERIGWDGYRSADIRERNEIAALQVCVTAQPLLHSVVMHGIVHDGRSGVKLHLYPIHLQFDVTKAFLADAAIVLRQHGGKSAHFLS